MAYVDVGAQLPPALVAHLAVDMTHHHQGWYAKICLVKRMGEAQAIHNFLGVQIGQDHKSIVDFTVTKLIDVNIYHIT